MLKNDKKQSTNPSALRFNLSKRFGLGGFVAVLMAFLVALPTLSVLSSLLFFDPELWQHLASTVLVEYLTNSFWLIIIVGALSLLFGVSTAWYTTAYEFPGSQIFTWALLLPLSMPAYIIAFTYTGLLEFNGPIQSFLRNTFDWQYGDYWFLDIRNIGGASTMLSLVLYPYIYLLSRSAFLEQSVAAMEASRTLGCSSRQAFFRIGIPLARPAIITGLSLVLMETLAEFGTMQYFGVQTFTTGIFRTWYGLYDSSGAAQLASMLLMFVMLLILLERHSRVSAKYFHHASRRKMQKTRLLGRKALLAFSVCMLPLLLGFLIPFIQLAIWTASDISILWSKAYLILARNSIQLAAITALCCIPPGLLLTYVIRRGTFTWVTTLIRFSTMGYAIPGTVIAIGVLSPAGWFDNTLDSFMRDRFDVSTGLLFSGSIAILVFAYTVRFFTVSLNTIEAGLGRIKPSTEEAARTLGLSPLQIVWQIHLPLARGSILTAFLIIFVDVLKELPATLVLRPFNFNTLAVSAFEIASDERLADAAPAAIAIVLTGIIPVIILSHSLKKNTGHGSSN